jgi:hypothetical protein
MGLWRQYQRQLPLEALAIRYEDLVADLAGEARRVIAFLGLPWDDGVLAYRERARDRTIATPSYHQVVEPIYRRAVGRWRRYRRYLGDAEPLLAPFVATFGYGEPQPTPPGPADA